MQAACHLCPWALFGVKDNVAGQVRALLAGGDHMQDAPCDDHVNGQGPFQPLDLPQLQGLDPAAGLQDAEEHLHQPAPPVPIDQLNGLFQGSRHAVSQEPPHHWRLAGRRVVLLRQDDSYFQAVAYGGMPFQDDP